MDGVAPRPSRGLILLRWLPMLAVLATLTGGSAVASDLATTVLFDGERNETLNNWGGGWGRDGAECVVVPSKLARAGQGALEVRLGNVPAGARRYVQCFASGFGPTPDYYQTRDLARFERIEFWARNGTGSPLAGFLQVKDWRDSEDHLATYPYTLPPEADWTRVVVPLRLDQGWTVRGDCDLRRVLSLDFVFQPASAVHGGVVGLDDVILVEPGGPIPVETAPLADLVERVARRQWDALWAARSRVHGMTPNNSYQSTDAGLNGTAAVLWMLPSATRRGWVARDEADRHVDLLLATVNRLLDQSKHLPPRNVDWVSLRPSLLPEESSVDAAFLALALHQYRSLSSTAPAVRESIERTEERFDFAAFSSPAGWHMAYRYASRLSAEGMVSLTYDGYTNEGNVVSLAAHLCGRRQVPVDTLWNANIQRVRAQLAAERNPVVHSWKEFRAPFAQALLNLFVDVRRRGIDIYPDEALAVNPWSNFVCYEQQVMARLAELGRPYLVQPDAGDDGTLTDYQQFSIYENFGRADLFMPWSVSFALLAEADGAEEALRFLLLHGLHGPLGLSDSARWETGAAEPYLISARHDFWNTALATMAMLEWLDGENRLSKSFSELPEVKEALDSVFPAERRPKTAARAAAERNLVSAEPAGAR